MEILIEFNGNNYTAVYNKNSGYFEIDLTAPDTGGIYDINITAIDALNNSCESVKKLQVLKIIETKIIINNVIAYFLDRFTFEIKDVVEILDYNVNIDEEINGKTTLSVAKKIISGDGDFVFIRENDEIVFMGIINSPKNEGGENKYSITAEYITKLFDRDILVKNENLIHEVGIEDFIKETIESEFINSEDSLLNIDYLDIEVLTHTKVNKSIDNAEKGIYNLHTYITNCNQNYNIAYDFKFANGRLKMIISKQKQETQLIDANTGDITNYTEVFKTNVTAKVTVKTATSIFNYFLLNNRTISTDINNENRAIGLIKTVYTEKNEDAEQTALNEFTSNSYEHLIQFDINSNSKLYDVKNWKIGTPVKMQTKNNVILDSYISAISKKKNSKFYSIKTGNIRITLLDKLKKEKNKRGK